MLAKEILMNSRLLLLFTVFLFTACAPHAAAAPIPTSAPAATSMQVEPITLRMAVADQEGEEPSTMKASMGFGLDIHDRFLIRFLLRAIQFDEQCDVGNIIIRLSRRSSINRSV
jgi:hypothetical protein